MEPVVKPPEGDDDRWVKHVSGASGARIRNKNQGAINIMNFKQVYYV